MSTIEQLDRIAISVKAHRLLKALLSENPRLEEIMRNTRDEREAREGVRHWVLEILQGSPLALAYYEGKNSGHQTFESLDWSDYAAIRLLDYIDHGGREFSDLNLRGALAVSHPIKLIWLAVNRGTGGAKPAFFEDMLHLFRQLSGRETRELPTRERVKEWMAQFPSGLDPRIVELRARSRERILNIIIDRMDNGEIHSRKFAFDPGMSRDEKFVRALEWWKDMHFHLNFAVRSPALLNELMGGSLDPDTMQVLYRAEQAGIPFFVNPYYLSLLHIRAPDFAIGADLAIRHYIVYSGALVEEFGHIVAWEKEDLVEPGKPNAAGWLLPPYDNVHRRYPDVAILIPDTTGRACGGLCASCQRMFDFQRGRLNFELERLQPQKTWPEKLTVLMKYFEEDSQLRDILITGGDALMNTDAALEKILDAVCDMALAKRQANRSRPDGEKYAEIVRVRLGTRLPVYLPQRITPALVQLLAQFREKAAAAGVRQFVIQTHVESAMEITPETREAMERLLSAGWVVTNQHVFTTSASRRGHAARLRQILNNVGVLPYYTFVLKGYRENTFNYSPVARAVQEEREEKAIGRVPDRFYDKLRAMPDEADKSIDRIAAIRNDANLPFLATDRSVLNLPAVGKSLTFRTIGITRYGRRILEFDYDRTRAHSPIIDSLGKMVVIESKSISEYLEQLDEMGENVSEYVDVYGYSLGETEPRMPVFEYPLYDYQVTGEITNLQLEPAEAGAD